MRFFIGKQIGGPRNYFPQFLLWGGCLFVNGWNRSLMVILPTWLIEELAIWGIDAIGD